MKSMRVVIALCLSAALPVAVWAAEEPVTGLVAKTGEHAVEGTRTGPAVRLFRPTEGDLAWYHAGPTDDAAAVILRGLRGGEEVKIAWHAEGDVRWIDKIDVQPLPTEGRDIRAEIEKVEKQRDAFKAERDKATKPQQDAHTAQIKVWLETQEKLKEVHEKVRQAEGKERDDLIKQRDELREALKEEREKVRERENDLRKEDQKYLPKVTALEYRLELLSKRRKERLSDWEGLDEQPKGPKPMRTPPNRDAPRREKMERERERERDKELKLEMQRAVEKAKRQREERERVLKSRKSETPAPVREKSDTVIPDRERSVRGVVQPVDRPIDEAATVTACSARKDGDRVVYVVGLKLDSGDNVITEVKPDAPELYKVASSLKNGDRVNVKGSARGVRMSIETLTKAKDAGE